MAATPVYFGAVIRPLTLSIALLGAAIGPLAAQVYIGVGADVGLFARGGQWSELYGAATEAGTRVELGFAGGLYLAPRASVLFGETVKQDPLSTLRDPSGRIIGDVSIEGRPTSSSLRSRGWRFGGLVGYQRALGKQGWGLRAAAGPSYTVHFIRIQDDPTITTTNLRDEYKRGYDRRAGGVGATLEAGVSYVNLTGSLRAYLVGTFDVMRSTALNSTQFDIGTAAPADGTDVAYGARFGFVLGLKRSARGSADEIYY